MVEVKADLRYVIKEASEELTRMGIAPAQRNYVYAPHLVALGYSLANALDDSFDALRGLRPDVLAFARVMSRMIDFKEAEDKKPLNSLYEALGNIHIQMRKVEDHTPLTTQDQARILIHIANWAMLGFGLLDKNIPAIF